jgi:hypothetical protein
LDGTARAGIGIRGLARTRSFRATESSTVRLVGDSIRLSSRSTLRSFLVMGTSIITSTLTAEAGIGVCTTIQAFAEAGITPVTDTLLRRRVDMLAMVSAAVAVEEQFMAVASPVAEAASMAAVVVDLAVEVTVTKDERLGYELC